MSDGLARVAHERDSFCQTRMWHKPTTFVLSNVRTCVNGTLPSRLADVDRQAEGCGQQMVSKTMRLAIAVEVLHGGHVAYLCRGSNASGDMILTLYAVGNGKGLVGILLVVQHTHAHIWNDTQSGKGVYIVLVEVVKDIPHKISTQVLIVLRGVVAVVELHTAIVQTTAYGGREPFAERPGECRFHATEEIVASNRFAEENGCPSCRLDKPVVRPCRGDQCPFHVGRFERA